MTLKEEEITRKEMAKILPSIQIGHIDKDVKQYLNNTIADIIGEDVNIDPPKDDMEPIDETKKLDKKPENEYAEDSISSTKQPKLDKEIMESKNERKQVIEENLMAKKLSDKLEDDIPSSAADDINSFLNNLIERVDEENKN